MRCPGCDHVSLGSCCAFCGRCEVPQAVAFSPLDIFDPIGLGKELGDSGINPLNPIGTGETIGRGVKSGDLFGGVKGATDSIASFAAVMKWVVIGGAVTVGGVLIYSAVKFIPKMAEAAAANVKESGKMASKIAERAV